MAARKKSKAGAKKEKRVRFSFLSDMNPDTKSIVLKGLGLAVAVFTVFTFVASLSYLFTWKADQSLMTQPDMMEKAVDVANAGGKLGYRWASFLVCRFLGLGSFAFVFLMGAVAYRLFFWNRSIGLLKTTFITVSGAFVSSLILAYFSMMFTPDTFFGGGLGGDAGHAVVAWMDNLFGKIVTALVVAVLAVAWLLFANGRFAHWLAVAGMDMGVKEDENADIPDAPVEEMMEAEPVVELEAEPVVIAEDPDVSDIAVEPEIMAEPETAPEPEITVEPEMQVEQVAQEIEIIRNYEPEVNVTEELERIDNRAELEKYEFPSLELLDDYAEGQHIVSNEELEINNNKIRSTLLNYKIEVMHVKAVVGPTVTLYKVVPAPGIKVSAIENLHREIGMSLGAKGVRVVVLPDCVGIEVANREPSIVPLKKALDDDSFRNTKYELPIAIGYTITKKVKTFDLASAPHLLVAGATQQGKSVGLNVIISSLLYAKHPSELKFVFIDPKMVEFTAYNSLLKHYLAVMPMAASEEDEREHAIVKDPRQAELVLNSLCIEMDERYKLLALAGVNNLKLYNEKYKDRFLLPTEGHK